MIANDDHHVRLRVNPFLLFSMLSIFSLLLSGLENRLCCPPYRKGRAKTSVRRTRPHSDAMFCKRYRMDRREYSIILLLPCDFLPFFQGVQQVDFSDVASPCQDRAHFLE